MATIKTPSPKGRAISRSLLLLICMLLAFAPLANAQDDDVYTDDDTASVITSDVFKENPAYYLRYIDSSNIPTGILIDRIKFKSDMCLYNGRSKVKTCDYAIFRRVLKHLQKAANNSINIPNLDSVWKYSYPKMRWGHIYPIAILNYQFNKVREKSIHEGLITETDTALIIESMSDSIFATRRAFLASPFSLRVHGDDVPFVFNKNMYYTNIASDSVTAIEANFGKGWKNFAWDEPQTISFGYRTSYIEVKVRLKITNVHSARTRTLYSHFTVLRSGTDMVPLPSVINTDKRKSATVIPEPDRLIYYPESKITYTPYCEKWENPCTPNPTKKKSATIADCPAVCVKTSLIPDFSYCDIEASILFAPSNISGKLRKPILICDGFDPGDIRDYFQTYIKSPKGDPKTDDSRGIFQLMNGEMSGWSKDTGAILVQDLRNRGYDIVFVNWLKGDGDIPTNADALRGFLNNVINASIYRDNLTEENILVGPSMGGIISRYCLTTMEKAVPAEEHHVKLWFSFDSPQQGANIPIALQWSVNYLDDVSETDDTKTALNKLNSPAAKQMLMYQYKAFNGTESQPAKHLPEFTYLYAKLDSLKYPLYSKNIAITNGANKSLYPNGWKKTISLNVTPDIASTRFVFQSGTCVAATVLAAGLSAGNPVAAFETWLSCEVFLGLFDVNVDVNGYNNQNAGTAASTIFDGEAVVTLGGATIANLTDNDYPNTFSTTDQIGFDNAPGGYHTALFDLNQAAENNTKPDTNTTTYPQYSKATFMPTVSAFGIKPTRDNVYKTWNQINISETPFDDRIGMTDYGNEEHCRVSDKTSIWLQNYLLNLRKDIQKPYSRTTGYTETESKACLYTANNTITFGGVTGSQFVFNATANVKLTAGTSIKFKPGVKLLKGAKLTAKTGTVNNGSQKAAAQIARPAITYLTPSPYKDKIYDYSEGSSPNLIKQVETKYVAIDVYPNPASDCINLKFSGINNGNASVSIRNIYGQVVLVNSIAPYGEKSLSIKSLSNGIYFIDVSTSNTSIHEKLIKK